jgi:hypothetical protein
MPQDPDRYQPLPSLLELPSFLLRKLPRRRRRMVTAAGALVLLAAVVAAAVVLPGADSQRHARASAAERRAAAQRIALLARYAREARPRTGRGPAAAGRRAPQALRSRRTLVAGLQAAVLADARERARRGELRGGYASTACFGYPKGLDTRPPADELGRPVAIMECLAVARNVASTARVTTGSLIGQPYRVRVDFAHGRYAYCKIVQTPGELSIQRGPVLHIPQACGGDAG